MLVTSNERPFFFIQYHLKRDEDIGNLKKSPAKISGSASFYVEKTKSI
jgi:hypothetical protein